MRNTTFIGTFTKLQRNMLRANVNKATERARKRFGTEYIGSWPTRVKKSESPVLYTNGKWTLHFCHDMKDTPLLVFHEESGSGDYYPLEDYKTLMKRLKRNELDLR